MPPPPKSPARISGGTGGRSASPDRPQRPGDRQVVDVEAGPLGERSVLAPTGHPPVDEARVAGEAGLRPESHAARPRRAGTPRSARRPARPGAARPRRPRGSSGRAARSAGCGRGSGRDGRGSRRSCSSMRSTSSTSAPMSESCMPANGPGPMQNSSTIFTPLNGPMPARLARRHAVAGRARTKATPVAPSWALADRPSRTPGLGGPT